MVAGVFLLFFLTISDKLFGGCSHSKPPRNCKKKCQRNPIAGGFGNSVCQIGKPLWVGVAPRQGGSPPWEGVTEAPHQMGVSPTAWGWFSAGRRRPATRAHFPGMHARFLFFVWSIVSRLVRAQLVKSAGRIFYVHELEPLPGRMPGRPSIVHEPGRPTSAACAGVLVCWCVPGRARAPTGSCDASQAWLDLCVHGRRLQSPYGLLRRLWPYHGRRKCTGMPAPARGRQRPRTSPRRHVHERRPAQLGGRHDACTGSASLENRPDIPAGRRARRPS